MLLKDAYFWNTALRNDHVFSGNLLLSLNLFTTSRDYHYVVNWCISDLTFTTLSKFSVLTSNTFVLCLLFYCKHTSVYLYDLCNRLSFPVQVAYLSINKTICQKHDRWVLWLPHTCLGWRWRPRFTHSWFWKGIHITDAKALNVFLGARNTNLQCYLDNTTWQRIVIVFAWHL